MGDPGVILWFIACGAALLTLAIWSYASWGGSSRSGNLRPPRASTRVRR